MPAYEDYDTNKDAHGRTDVLHDPKWLQASINARTNNGRRAPDQQAQEWMAALDQLGSQPSTQAAQPRPATPATPVDSALDTWDWRSAINSPTSTKQGGVSK